MKTRVLALLVALGFLGFVGMFIWAALRLPAPEQVSAAGIVPAASVSKALSGGRIDVQVAALGNRDVRLDIRFTPDAGAAATTARRPDVTVAMVGMPMSGFGPPLQGVETGRWRADFNVPMAGRWIVNAGIGGDFAGVEFDAR